MSSLSKTVVNFIKNSEMQWKVVVLHSSLKEFTAYELFENMTTMARPMIKE